jgi:hypothetical protein
MAAVRLALEAKASWSAAQAKKADAARTAGMRSRSLSFQG